MFGIGIDECSLAVLRDERGKYVHFTGHAAALLRPRRTIRDELVNRADDPAYASTVLEYAQRLLSLRMRNAERTLTGVLVTPHGRHRGPPRGSAAGCETDDHVLTGRTPITLVKHVIAKPPERRRLPGQAERRVDRRELGRIPARSWKSVRLRSQPVGSVTVLKAGVRGFRPPPQSRGSRRARPEGAHLLAELGRHHMTSRRAATSAIARRSRDRPRASRPGGRAPRRPGAGRRAGRRALVGALVARRLGHRGRRSSPDPARVPARPAAAARRADAAARWT